MSTPLLVALQCNHLQITLIFLLSTNTTASYHNHHSHQSQSNVPMSTPCQHPLSVSMSTP